MTENESEVLAALYETLNSPAGFRPLDFGGSSNSHHAQTAIRMVNKHWVERNFGAGWGEPKGHAYRGSCRYRITPAGVKALRNHRAMIKAATSKAAADALADKP